MKLRNKLILSCAALAAVATTAVSTTFAWYTSNTEVTANTLKAKTDNNGADTLLISKTGAAGTWSNSITYSEAAKALKPVEYTAGASNALGTYKGWDSASHAVGAQISDVTADESGVMRYTFYLKDQTATANTAVYIKTVTATFGKLDTYKAKDVLVTDGLGTYSSKAYDGATYEVSLQRALDFEFQVKEANNVKNATDEKQTDGETAVTWTNVSAGVYAFDQYSQISDTLSNANDDYNAHTYYNKALGTSITTTDPLASTVKQIIPTAAGATTWTALTAKPTAVYEINVTIFLNGWDLACFDAVQGQTFTVNFEFSTSDKSIAHKIAASE